MAREAGQPAEATPATDRRSHVRPWPRPSANILVPRCYAMSGDRRVRAGVAEAGRGGSPSATASGTRTAPHPRVRRRVDEADGQWTRLRPGVLVMGVTFPFTLASALRAFSSK